MAVAPVSAYTVTSRLAAPVGPRSRRVHRQSAGVSPGLIAERSNCAGEAHFQLELAHPDASVLTMAAGARRGSDSRCCDPSSAPWEWVLYVDSAHEACVELDEWFESLAPFARSIERGEIDDLFEAASRGELSDSGDARTPIKPIRHDPEIFELRRKALSKQLRFYHGEPPELPTSLVSLHRHIKVDDASQQTQIEYAADRYERGRPDLWM